MQEKTDPLLELEKDVKEKTPYAFLFPSMSSQYKGMGTKLCQNSNRAKELFGSASEIAGFDLLKKL